jgi:glycosyltransferase involved in cell wall biosynthesis
MAGHRFGISDADYRGASGPIARLLLRWRMYVVYPARLAWACLWQRGSHIHVISTNPFFAPLVAMLLARKRQKVVHLVYDLFPDALVVGGIIHPDSAVAECVRWIVTRTFARASANVFLGRRLLEYAESQHGSIARHRIIHIGADASPFATFPPKAVADHQTVEILYCGNLGAGHDIETFLEGIKATIPEAAVLNNVVFTFHASGSLYCALKRVVSGNASLLNRIRLKDALPEKDWIRCMRRAHVALVTIRRGAERVVMPSKTYSAMAAGQAILAICPRDSDLADIVRAEECGWIVAPGRPQDLRGVLAEIASRRDLLQQKRVNAFAAGQGKFSEVAVGKEWIGLLEELTGVE